MPVSDSVTSLYPNLAGMAPAVFGAFSASAESWLTRYLGRSLGAGTFTDIFSGVNHPVLFLKNTPVTGVLNITVQNGTTETVYLPGDHHYSWHADGQVHLSPSGFFNQMAGWHAGVQNIRVTYTSTGFDQHVQDMLIGSVMNWWHDLGQRSGLVDSEKIGDYSYTMRQGFKTIPPSVNALISQFRDPLAI